MLQYKRDYFSFLLKRKNNKIIFANEAKWIIKSLANNIAFNLNRVNKEHDPGIII